MQTGSSETLIGWKSGKSTYVSLRDRMEGAWLWTLIERKPCTVMGLTVLRIPSNQSASNSAKADLFMVNIKHRGERLRERWDAGFSDSVSWEGGGQ
jgi:hypothetical protein